MLVAVGACLQIGSQQFEYIMSKEMPLLPRQTKLL